MITITHTHADGTMLDGSAKGDGVYDLLRGLRDNWRYFPSIRAIGIGQSRDRNADTYKIKRAAEALRAAGHEVTVTVDESERRSFAEAEAQRYESAEARAERMAGYAANAAARSEAGFARAAGIADMIPMGQPVLVGHHSEGRHRRDLARMDAGMRAGVDESRKAEHFEQRAATAERYQAHRESVPVTLRRIAKLEAEERGIVRDIEGGTRGRHPYIREVAPATGAYLERLNVSLADIREQLAYWRGIVAKAADTGVKVWTRADFAKGDFAKRRGQWVEVLRVNAKSLTVPAILDMRPVATREGQQYSWTDTLPYDGVTGRKSADEMAELLAEVERRESVSA